MRRLAAVVTWLAGYALTGCTGLVAGPEVKASTPVPAVRDSAYTRSRRALQAESFTMDVMDSSGGRLTGTRYPSADAKLGTSARCRVVVASVLSADDDAARRSGSSYCRRRRPAAASIRRP
jgi:hypothetical protein